MLIVQLINLLLFGFAVGIMGTYIGVGGGFLHVPTLLYFYGATPQQAIGTSLVVVLFNALSGSYNYAKQKRIDYNTGWKFALATIPGAIIGVYLTRFFEVGSFSMVFGIFLLLIAVVTLIKPFLSTLKNTFSGKSRKKADNILSGNTVKTGVQKKRGNKVSREIIDDLGNKYRYSINLKLGCIFSVFIGFCSSLLGVGGGILHVPILINIFNIPVHVATATSHFILAISALFGSVFHYTQGNVILLPAVFMSLGTIMGAQLGANLARRSRPIWVSLILSFVLFFIGFQMVKIDMSSLVIPESAVANRRPGQTIDTIAKASPMGSAHPVALKAGNIVDTTTKASPMAAHTPVVPPGNPVDTTTKASPAIHSPVKVPSAQKNAPVIDSTTKASPKLLPGIKLLGADVINVDPIIAGQFKLNDIQGVMVNGILSGSGAEKGGLKRGDVIVKFEGMKIKDVNHLEKMINGEQIGEQINMQVIRNGKPQVVFISIGKKPKIMQMKQIALARKAGVHIGYVVLILTVVFYFLFRGWFERVIVVSIGAVGLVWVGSYHGFYNIHQASQSIAWNTMALLLGMNLISAVFSESGFFNYLAKKITLLTKGKEELVFIIFCLATYFLSCFVNNLSAILIVLPIMFGLSRQLEFDPKPYIIGIIIASNFGGASTMVGDFPNMLIGSEIGIPFNAFIIYMMPVNLFMLVILILYIQKRRKSLPENARGIASRIKLDNMLEDISKQIKTAIKNKSASLRAGIILFCVFAAFVFSNSLGISPAYIALLGGAAALVWGGAGIKPVLKRIQVNDFIFFISLFVLVGGVRSLGLLDLVSHKMLKTVGDNVLVLSLILMWVAGIATCFLNAGPTTALFIPIVKSFSLVAPHYLFWWALSLGVCAGSSGTLTGATAGPVSATMYDKFLKRERAGNKNNQQVQDKKARKEMRLTFNNYAKLGVPLMIIYLGVASAYVIWLFKY